MTNEMTISGNKIPFVQEWIYFLRLNGDIYDTFTSTSKLDANEMVTVLRGYEEALGVKDD